jgi:predicted secreted protein
MNTLIRFSDLFFVVLFSTAMMLCNAGCQTGPTLPSDAVRVTQDQNNSSITLTSGKMLIIELERNPSTGYVWQLIEMPNQAVLLPDGTKDWRKSQPGGGDSNIETQYIRFVGEQPGETNIRLNYIRANLSPDESTPTFTVHVKVTP